MSFTFKLAQRWSRFRNVVVTATLVVGACEFQRAVLPNEIARVELTPSTVTVQPQQSADFTAVVLDSEGDTAEAVVHWSATGGSIADMGANGGQHLGRYQSSTCGSYRVVATSEPGAKADTANVTVTCAPPDPVARVDVTPGTASILIGGNVQLTATPRNASGAALSGRVVTWVSSAPGVAGVSASGRVSGLAAGSAVITATSEGIDGTADVTVTAPPPPPPGCLVSSSAWANTPFAAENGTFTAQFDATPNGSSMDGLTSLSQGPVAGNGDMAVTVRFNSAGQIDARNGGGYSAASAIPYTPGTSYRFRLVVDVATHTYAAYVTPAGGSELTIGTGMAFRTEQNAVAALDNLAVQANVSTHLVCDFAISGSTPRVPVASVTVEPASASVEEGASAQLTARTFDANGAELTGRAVIWTSSNLGIATVNTAGRVTGIATGSATITATSEGQAGTATVTVTQAAVASVSVAPPAATIDTGATVQLAGTPRSASGAPLSGRVVTWESSNTAVATVSGSGLVRGVTPGTATITATSEGQSGTSLITVVLPPPPGSAFTFVGAGDIANCGTSTDEATAKLLDGIAGTVWTAGDNAYPDGTASNFSDCYEPTWGRHKTRTRPSPGNHDYHTSGASAYYAYFGANAGPAGRGYYSFDLGDWHIISLNSEASMSAGSAQEQWLRADLAASTKQCTIAYWHHPRWSSGDHGNVSLSGPIWTALYEAGAEIVLNGHDHNYERFAPQTPGAVRDDARGIREFVVGTGGTGLRSFASIVANSEVRNSDTHGVLKLTLSVGRYDWEFIPVAGKTFTDRGSGTCH